MRAANRVLTSPAAPAEAIDDLLRGLDPDAADALLRECQRKPAAARAVPHRLSRGCQALSARGRGARLQ